MKLNKEELWCYYRASEPNDTKYINYKMTLRKRAHGALIAKDKYFVYNRFDLKDSKWQYIHYIIPWVLICD